MMRLLPLRLRAPWFVVLALLAACGGDDDPVDPDPDPEPPGAPSGVTVASVGEGSVTISWAAVTGATSYTVYHASQSGVTKDNYEDLPNSGRITNAVSPLEITGLEGGIEHYFVVTASNADGESPVSAQVSAMPTAALAPTDDLELAAGEHLFTRVDIPAGVTVTAAGPVTIEVEGDAVVDGTLAGDCHAIELRVAGSIDVAGLLTNTCATAPEGDAPGLTIVADGDLLFGTEASDDVTIASDGVVRITDTATEDEDLEPQIDVEALASPIAPGVPARQAGGPVRTFDNPIEAGELRLSFEGDVVVGANLTMANGADAAGIEGDPVCDNSAATGGAGGDIYLFAVNGTLTVNGGVTLTAGDGGAGGGCTATGQGAVAIAGEGGRGGGVYLGGQALVFEADVMVVRGNGGTGGRAEADGNHATEACEDGWTATATGGKGGRAGGAGYLSEAVPVIQGNPMEDGGNGGKGGAGNARGGDGATCVCEAEDRAGGDGADGTATGGQGGDGARGSLFTIVANSHRKGEGGDAEALGGFGGHGASCCDDGTAGGDGGNGGAATATGGAEGQRGINDGKQGGAITFGGDAGNGGDGNDPGSGGTGGTATSDGDPLEENQGDDGLDGEPCPPAEGVIGVALSVAQDPSDHEPHTQIAATVDELTVSISGGLVSITGNGNFIAVTGDIDQDGNFIATGVGAAAGITGVSAELVGTVVRDESGTPVGVTGTYTVGGNGALPGGQPVSYNVASD